MMHQYARLDAETHDQPRVPTSSEVSGSPALVFVNGAAAVRGFEALHPRDLRWREVRYPSVDRPDKTLWHCEGHYQGAGTAVPAIGFPFLRKPAIHNSNAEIAQLGDRAARFLKSVVE
jgi:hypothetical protein